MVARANGRFNLVMTNADIYIHITRILSDNAIGLRLIARYKLPYSTHGVDTMN